MTDTDNVPQVLSEASNICGRGYTLTESQKYRKRHGMSLYERDRKIEEYKYSKGEWV
jgi:hypothetical protein